MIKNIKILKSFYYLFNEEEIKSFCENKTGVYMVLNEITKKKISDKAKLRHSDLVFKEKHRKKCLLTNVSSKPVRVLDGTTREFIASFPSLKSVQKYYNYNIFYRHLKRFVAEKKVIRKLNIFVEYI